MTTPSENAAHEGYVQYATRNPGVAEFVDPHEAGACTHLPCPGEPIEAVRAQAAVLRAALVFACEDGWGDGEHLADLYVAKARGGEKVAVPVAPWCPSCSYATAVGHTHRYYLDGTERFDTIECTDPWHGERFTTRPGRSSDG